MKAAEWYSIGSGFSLVWALYFIMWAIYLEDSVRVLEIPGGRPRPAILAAIACVLVCLAISFAILASQ